MIIYNFRYNGPYEFDKFVLNIGQLHNIVSDEKKIYKNHNLNETLEELDNIIKKNVVGNGEITLLNRLLLLKKDRGEKR